MPSFNAIALDHLLDQGPSNSVSPTRSTLDRPNPSPVTAYSRPDVRAPPPVSVHNRNPSIPLPPVRPSASSSNPATSTAQRPHISPALYSTPESTPLPDSPTSFSSSPYIINHKRRGPRLQKAEAAAVKGKAVVVVDEQQVVVPSGACHPRDSEVEVKSSSADVEAKVTTLYGQPIGDGAAFEDVAGSISVERESEFEDFYDPQDSMSFTSNTTDGEDFYTDQSARESTPSGVFYDAWEELSSDSGRQPKSFMNDIEAELRGMRVNLLMEVVKSKQAEDALVNMQSQWQNLREKLREAGLFLPAYLSTTAEDAQMNVDWMEDVSQQVYITRFVSESIGREVARAEFEEELEAQLESKNFEIARLNDRLHYYETMNHEMSQRNQEAIEHARSNRQKKSKIQKWVWGSVFSAITLGSTALAYTYLSANGSPSSHQLQTSEPDTGTE